ncbi:cellulose biosynthesis cyclic di-GMP-binding regulatory protein BcsB [Rhizobium lentis]|uniref:cellulose biosynthesis cyclic di-GMP-binding regulatory protein BcsB n=1 Tax=Rhizobium lentis TaxID=1138194 RepID=UPI001C83D4FB|nr:cellulose biosynthesis cyclic di-GMP-binding regulatory protein BcsB [Rhizobium lentis]MBX4956343.1 cellulose biosynthesis cyclic di-GMP-binding regulatory protein BcsB [Rhizobium lentis]MBX4974747.1 cellulose biosynthesis cyclic di-GMP-binding regulatory protein BcsB [Rhizobium lentis]MBX4986040.1 cellulose biosynthesis cyclic di-GMP-binding regulatory protein BcsB [Rhizobium lentis]MBX5004484.1 cellulose biosynthesis cyclic di-GMP-binding regulatory protein BcsB [Rhizobium lentis]MBX50289
MRTIAAASLLLLNASAFAQAQTAPFDMSGERPPGVSVTPRLTQPAPPPAVTPPAPVKPAAAPPPIVVQPQPALQPAAAANRAAPLSFGDIRRYVVPFSKFGLAGEYDRRSWSVYLTPEQAAAKASFTFAYQNAIVVAPEASALTVYLNNRPIGQQRVGSPDGSSAVTFEVPPGLLQPGANLVTFEADQRHRTDCSIQSTYELWSNIDPAGTYLSFAGSEAAQLSSADAVRAVGVDGAGKTQFDILVPALEQPGMTKPLLRLAQGLSVLSSMPNQIFAFSTNSLPAAGPGRLGVLVGTAAELRPLFPGLPAGAESAALAAFVTDPRSGSPVLLISGPSWQAVSSAIDTIVSPTDRSVDVRRDALATERWSAPNAPLIFSDTSIALSQLGVKTTEFSGRRFRTSFNIAVPADFYANAYGEAKVLLDAAYTENVLPGSHIDIYVNDNIASTVPLTSTTGGILRHLPIRVTMRHFKPGLNTVSIETTLMTKDDAACAPGATAGANPRFALFDTSEVHIPDFARVGQRPNLAAMAGTAYPYSRATDPTPLFIDRVDADTLSAAATLLGQMAVMAGHPIDVETVASPNTIGDRDAIFIGSISQMPATVLTQANISAASQASWRPVTDTQPGVVDTGTAFEEWNSKVSGGILRSRIIAFREWLGRSFDISRSSLQFIPGAEEVFTPSNVDTLMIAQGASPLGGGSWTVVAAPSAKDLREGLEVLTGQLNWPQISGHITTYSSKTGKIDTVPVTRFDFVPSTPWSIGNYRLIAANWLSTNILSYASLLVVFLLLIGVATSKMLKTLGRSG